MVAHAAHGAPVERYAVALPEVGTTGDVLAPGTFAGVGVGEVRDVPPNPEPFAASVHLKRYTGTVSTGWLCIALTSASMKSAVANGTCA